MAVDEVLAQRVRSLLGGAPGLTEKRMFGGLAFLLNGNMAVGVRGEDLIVRLPPEETEPALAQPGVRLFDLSGRPMRGWLLVAPAAVAQAGALASWVERGLAFAATFPPK